ncbi:MAG: phage tail protein [Halieaceae bacterium]|jgi:hypothetical protein|nr:phage tail protein [Halieaceae bacterium]
MNLSTDQLFELLPAYLRLRDAEEGRRLKREIDPDSTSRDIEDFGPLRTLASLVAREAQVTDEALEDIYANAFIETCAPWAIPYLGDLLGVRGLEDIPEGLDMRARVANALELRSRKGTLRALEQAAADSSGWPVYAVEYWKRLVHTQSMRLTHPMMGRTVNTRNKAEMARIGTAFERSARNAEVRRVEVGGRWMLGNIGLHVWRLRPYSITSHVVRPVGSRRDFRFHPLGCDAALFARRGIDGGVDAPSSEWDMPAPITRELLEEDLSRPEAERVFYGPGRAMLVQVGANELPADTIRAANLGSRAAPGAPEPDWTRTGGIAGLTLIDPELGRLVVDPALSGPVRVSCHFARALELGGGEHSRVGTLGSIEDGSAIAPSNNLVTAINNAGGAGTFLLEQSSHYDANGRIVVPADGSLRLLASDGAFPTVRVGAAELEIELGDNASLELNGLRLHNGVVHVLGTGSQIDIRDCTLVPGRSLAIDAAPRDAGELSLDCRTLGAALRMDRCISGPMVVAEDMDVRVAESIIDAGDPDTPAFRPAAGAERVTVGFDRCTILGRVSTGAFASGARTAPAGFGVAIESDDRLASSDTVFFGRSAPAVLAEYRQPGCLRFSYVPPGSLAPRLYRCVRAPEPIFESTRYTSPDYLLLAPGTDEAITRGAENGGEMGAYNRAAHQVRADNIRRSIDDFLRFGHAAGQCYET